MQHSGVGREAEKPRLSVVIPCLNAAGTLGGLLDSLAAQEWCEPWEVVIADNGSTDGSKEIAESYRDRLPRLWIVDASARPGQPFALNAGIEAADGEAVVFVDADDIVAPGWVRAIGEALLDGDFVASRHDSAKLNPEWLVKGRGRDQRDGLQRLWYPPYALHAGGCGLGVKRSLLARLGGFDERLPYLHDTDLCLRLQREGVRLQFVKDATVYIRFKDSLRGAFKQACLWARYNELIYKRYRPAGVAISHPWRRYLSGWKYILGRLPRCLRKNAYTSFAWLIGWQVGLLLGSLKYGIEPAAYPLGKVAGDCSPGVAGSSTPSLRAAR